MPLKWSLSVCFLRLFQESEGQGCPFCRCEIKGTEPIVVDPFHPKASGASFAGFQASSRAEAAANEEEEDDRLEDQHLVIGRLACAKVTRLNDIRLIGWRNVSECLNVDVKVERPASPVSQLPPVPPRLDLLQQRSSCSHAALGQGAAAKVSRTACCSPCSLALHHSGQEVLKYFLS